MTGSAGSGATVWFGAGNGVGSGDAGCVGSGVCEALAGHVRLSVGVAAATLDSALSDFVGAGFGAAGFGVLASGLTTASVS